MLFRSLIERLVVTVKDPLIEPVHFPEEIQASREDARTMFAKLRLFRVTDLLGVAFILALLGLLFFYILRG